MAIMMSGAEDLYLLLTKKSGLSSEEVSARVEAKKESLGHLVNDDVAIRLVARDLGIIISENGSPKPILKIQDLVSNINNVSLMLTVIQKYAIKEFYRKDGSIGKLTRLIISDDTGSSTLVLWDEKTAYAENLMPGTKVGVYSAYTKTGLNGEIEIHMGNRSRLEIIEQSPSDYVKKEPSVRKGRILRSYDPINFVRRDGIQGSVVAFQMANEIETIRVLVWNPSETLVTDLIPGVAVEILGGDIKLDLKGARELHVNDEVGVKVDKDDLIIPRKENIRLAEIQPEASDLVVEGIVEGDFDLEATQSGKSYTKVLLRDGDTILPVVFWNDKALVVKRVAKAGSIIRIEGCYAKIGPRGLELNVNRWSKIRAE